MSFNEPQKYLQTLSKASPLEKTMFSGWRLVGIMKNLASEEFLIKAS